MKKYVQVTYSLNSEDVVNREFRALEMIDDNFEKIVISTDTLNQSRKVIKHMNMIDFLME